MGDRALGDRDELLFRQVHPSFLHEGHPSSQSFMPTPKDNGRLSCDRSSMTSAAQSFLRYTSVEGRSSAGVLGVTVGEFADQRVSCFDDPIAAGGGHAGNPAHRVADYSPLAPTVRKIAAKRLTRIAIDRGWLQG